MILRKAHKNDFPAWTAYYRGKKAAQNEWDTGPLAESDLSYDKFLAYLDSREKWSAEDFVHTYHGFNINNGEMIGRIEIGTIARHIYQMANLYYEVSNRHWNQGLGTKLAWQGLKIAFAEHNYHRVEFAIATRNSSSMRIAEKLGMNNEGLKEKYLLLGGKWHDFNLFTMRSDLWTEHARIERKRTS